MKKCTHCNDSKSYLEFYQNPLTKDGYASWCKCCLKTYSLSDGCKQVRRVRNLKRLYGLTSSDYESLLVSQGGTCAICKTDDPNSKDGRWHVDHNHVTNGVRGLLCGTCNVGLGMFKDSPAILALAQRYLEKI